MLVMRRPAHSGLGGRGRHPERDPREPNRKDGGADSSDEHQEHTACYVALLRVDRLRKRPRLQRREPWLRARCWEVGRKRTAPQRRGLALRRGEMGEASNTKPAE